MMKRLFIISIVLSFAFAPCKKKLDHAFEALYIYDYFKAKNLFDKVFEKEPVAASYGLGKIYFEERNHFFDLDSSEKHLNYAINYFKILDVKEKAKLLRWNIDSTQLAKAKDDLASKIFKRYLNAEDQSTVDSFLERFPNFSDRFSAINLRNSLAFEAAKTDGSLFALKAFIDNYPEALELAKAQELYDRIQFEQNTSAGTEEDLVKFIQEHADSPYLRQSQDKLYRIYQAKDRFQDYELFMKKYPENPNYKKAADQLIELALYDFRKESLDTLIQEFPRLKTLDRFNKYAQFFEQYIKESEVKNGDLFENTEEGFRTVFSEERVNFINPLFEEILDDYFEDALGFDQGLCVVFKEGKYGLIDRRGKEILPFEYDEIGEFSSGLIMAYKGEEYLYFDKTGEEKLSINVLPVGDFEGQYLLVKDGNGYGMIDKEKNFILEPNFEWLEHFNEKSIARFRMASKYGLINANADTLLRPEYDFISLAKDGIRILEKEEQLTFIKDTLMSEIYSIHDRRASQFRDGFSVVSRKGKFGIIDSEFKEVLTLKYPEIKNLGHGHFSIKERTKFKFFNSEIGKVGSKLYDNIRSGNRELLIFNNKDFDGLIDKLENVIYKRESFLNPIGKYFTTRNTEEKLGLLNPEGLEIVKIEFDKIEKLDEHKFKLIKADKIFIYDALKGEEILLD